MEEFDSGFQRYVINCCVSLSRLMERAGESVSIQGTMFCPFHPDKEGGHRSAKLYQDEAMESLFCFAERRMYHSSDYISRILGRSIPSVFEKIWSQLEPARRDRLLAGYGKPRQVLPPNWSSVLDKARPFKTGDQTYCDFLGALLAGFADS